MANAHLAAIGPVDDGSVPFWPSASPRPVQGAHGQSLQGPRSLGRCPLRLPVSVGPRPDFVASLSS